MAKLQPMMLAAFGSLAAQSYAAIPAMPSQLRGGARSLTSSTSSSAVACTYSKTYEYPTGVTQADSTDVSQMDTRCSSASESYVDDDSEATCILNSNGDGYDYGNVQSSSACPYTQETANMTQADCVTQFDEWIALGATTLTLSDGTEVMTGIGHGVLDGVRGNCAKLTYNDKVAVVLQVDIRSWSLEITYDTLMYLTDNTDPGGNCFIPTVETVDCSMVLDAARRLSSSLHV
eukprot:TRINITY_DN1164_c0_g1_i4.p1 TRINITY_DN1164_c0_g1~~TRINITY_DN1164_c0_g1_i4.p1  ORF type:complete len:254 (+),score=39.11 TRINITY_DN1164_c0_g1_i4:65-763(+)